MAKNIKRRSKFLVNHAVQGALGLRIVAHWLLFLAVSFVVTTLLRLVGNIGTVPTAEVLWMSMTDQIVPAIVCLALLPWFVHDSLKLSNRFAGPITRLSTAIRRLRDSSEVDPVQFRKGDFWIEVATEFNELQGRVLEDRGELEALRNAATSSNETSEGTTDATQPIAVISGGTTQGLSTQGLSTPSGV